MSLPSLAELLPHRPPMRWLDTLVARDGDAVQCRVTVREEQVFVREGSAEALIAIEWMAQAVGALVGLIDRERSEAPRPGYLIAVPQASFEVESFAIGETLDVFAQRVWGSEELASFEGRVELAGQVVARAQLSVYRRVLSREGMS